MQALTFLAVITLENYSEVWSCLFYRYINCQCIKSEYMNVLNKCFFGIDSIFQDIKASLKGETQI